MFDGASSSLQSPPHITVERTRLALSILYGPTPQDSGATQQLDDDLGEYFPHFLWVLRDFALQLKGETFRFHP